MAVRQRGPMRRAFTTALDSLMAELVKDQWNAATVDSLFKKLQTRREILTEMDEKVEAELLADDTTTEQAMEAEMTSVLEYRDKYTDVELLVEAKLKPKEDFETASNGSGGTSKKTYRLPKLEWKKFGGDPKDWLGFWSQFESIHEDQYMAAADKFQYLIQATVEKSKAREVVESFPPSPANYPKVIEYLKKRFGKEDVLVEVYTRELLRLVLDKKTERSGSIASLYDKLETQLRALESLGIKTESNIAILYPLVESAIPEETLRAWERRRSSLEDDDAKKRLERLMEFLRSEVESEERIALAKTGFEKKDTSQRTSRPQKEKAVPTAMDLVNQDDWKKKKCIFCEKTNHNSSDCLKARDWPLEKKSNVVKKSNVCFHCLQRGHFSKTCKYKPRCHLCDQPHHVIMCPANPKNKTEGGGANEDRGENSAGTSGMSMNNICASKVILQTLEVKLIGEKETCNVRVLIDSGSEHSYISKKVAAVMGAKSVGIRKMAHSLFGGQQTGEQSHRVYHVEMSNMDKTHSEIFEVLDQQRICGRVSSVPAGPWIQELKDCGIKLTDVGNDQREIHVLLGADVAPQLYTGRMFHLKTGLLAKETVFGWALEGKAKVKESVSSSMVVTSLHVSSLDIQDLWKLKTIGITDPVGTKSKEQLTKEAQEHFDRTVSRREDGRYEVSLPWIEGHPPVSNNRDIAEKRLQTAYKKLEHSGNVKDYQKIFDEWESMGVIERVGEAEVEGKSYLPHRAVFKPSSLTTPIRPCFDASAKKGGLPSLNDCLEKGPNLIELLPDIIIGFRLRRYGVISDIKKAFLMISLKKEDREFLRFLWWEKGKLTEYRHCRVVFGVSSSPFLLAATLKHHFKSVQGSDRRIAEMLEKSMYVDNSVLSVDTKEELIEFMDKATHILSQAKMELRGWEWSRSAGALEKENPAEFVPVLGMIWNTVLDTIKLDISGLEDGEVPLETPVETSGAGSLTSSGCRLVVGRREETLTVSKRQILSAAQKVFDLIGVTCPTTLVPKLILQELWKTKISWDAPVPEEVALRFLKWKKELPNLGKIQIPRWIAGSAGDKKTLHTFTDSSKSAYSACVFLRVESCLGVQVNLVLAKARVAPTKKMTIPRLELLGCNVGARLADSVKKAIGEDLPYTYWTDSADALCWIQRTENWTTFVYNRVQEIKRLSRPEDWRHVAGTLNPADLPSRGCSAKQLLQSGWWEGPSWLYLPEEDWPRSSVKCDEKVVMSEKKKTVLSQVSTKKEDPWYLQRFSNYRKIVRTVGWMLRWRRLTTMKEGPLTAEEEEQAELYLLRMVQQESFSEGDQILKQLRAKKDDFGLWRVQTKIVMREDFQDFRFPILLPSDHKVVKLLLTHEHLKRSHCGTHVMLSSIRERFWIPKSRRTICEMLHRCLQCRRHKVKRVEAIEAPLPIDRVRDAAVFEVTGVDLGGPLYLRGKEKVWFAVFTCAVYRAVHIEIVSSLSTEGFLMALRRFISRRGRPSTIYSDNGTNFEGANNALRKLDWKSITEETAVQRIRWIFNPPSAPWWGGWWERIVGIVKGLLRRILGRASLNYEELATVLCDVEDVCNSRPLTYISEDPEDLVQLSPSMFLMDIKTTGVPDLDAVDEKSLNKRLKYRQQLRKDLRERFRTEYLGMLIHQKNQKKGINIKPGDVVLIGDDNKKRVDWRMGCVIELYPGTDGVERVAKLKTAYGEITRPVQRLYPLEMKKEEALEELPVKEVDEDTRLKTRSGRIIRMPSRFMDSV